MNYILFDNQQDRENLLPFTFTRPVAAIRIGILTIAEKWEKLLLSPVSYLTQDYLQEKFAIKLSNNNIFINGSICPNQLLVDEINNLKEGEALVKGNIIIAFYNQLFVENDNISEAFKLIETKADKFLHIQFPHHIFSQNGAAIQNDFQLITANRKSQPISATNQVIAPENVFIEEGAKVECSILNASTGPIYIGKDAEIMEGCKVRGPFSLGEHAGLKMDAKIYGPTTVGPHCKVGGEVNNVVFFGYSNKGHDGFVGNAVIGEWVNMGADTNNSNLKNTYDEVKLWSYPSQKFEKTGLTFCGLMMADHAKCGINTMFNTGTVVGVGANLFGAGFPRNYIPDFAWGGAQGFETFVLSKFFKTAEAVYKRRNMELNDIDRKILTYIFNETKQYRFWENKQ
ncbi:MAG: GlmU family protein [Bacteroidota bacterium]